MSVPVVTCIKQVQIIGQCSQHVSWSQEVSWDDRACLWNRYEAPCACAAMLPAIGSSEACPPAHADSLLTQASTNTILAHFASIVFANWLQKILLKPSKSGIAAAKPDEPDYTQRRGPSGTRYG